MPELLLELFSEEIPARMQARAADDLRRLVAGKLEKAGLTFGSAAAFATPRRLALAVDGLPARAPDRREERRGPRADAPERAIAGFLGSVGLAREQVEERDTPRGRFLFAVVEEKGAETRDALPGLLVEAIHELPWPKSMRWGGNSFRWVRPLHRVLAVFDGAPLAGGLDLGGAILPFTDRTSGHRFLAPAEFAAAGFADYRRKLREAFVVLDREERKSAIAEGAAALAAAEGLRLRHDPGLLEEAAGLVEWPVPLVGRIDAAYMDLPPEVLVTAMRAHQKYFALEDAGGALAPRFVAVSNMASDPARDATIVAGNEKVLRARLSDALFFWDRDRAETLESRLPALAEVAFYDRLGSMADKAARIEALAGKLAAFVPGCDAAPARRAARLAKADLTTGTVGEFPELQGAMGRHYAANDGEAAGVCAAIAEHYAPAGPSDACPTAPVSVAVALADKLDTLAGFFAIGERPTGSKDPFALRRAALGVVRLAVENGIALPLRRAVGLALEGYDGLEEAPELLEFFADRLRAHLRANGARHDLVSAVFAPGAEDDLNRLIARVEALSDFLESDDGGDLLTAYRRAANILRIEEKRDGRRYRDAPDPDLLRAPEERALFGALDDIGARVAPPLAAGDFAGAMAVLAEPRGPVDAFFDKVTVNADDPAARGNRLRLLSEVVATMDRVADFSQVEG